VTIVSFHTRGLSVRYGAGAPRVLDGIDLDVEAGTLHAILGPNGSGKSTLMKALLGRVPAQTGEVRIGERPLSDWSRRELARRVGAVSQQETIAFPISVRELVEMGRYPHLGPFRPMGPDDRRAVGDALARCDVLGLEERAVATLSGGELQRVRIARALAQEPGALVLDEPTASLDIRHEMAILRVLRASADEGTTVILVTHHLNLAARFADRVLLLDEGRVAAEGAVNDVFRPEILEAVYRWPLSVAPDPATGTPAVTPLLGPSERPPGGAQPSMSSRYES
jgi:iron complex transport system ATP-binding protein